MGENVVESPGLGFTGVGSVGANYDYARTTALDMAIRAVGTGAPINRIADAADAFYRFLTAK